MNNHIETSRLYYLSNTSDAALAYDGMDEIDLENSDIDLIRDFLRTNRDGQGQGAPEKPFNVRMRRGVQPCNYIRQFSSDIVLVKKNFFDKNLTILQSSLVDCVDVICHFGKRTRRYVLGNLKPKKTITDAVSWQNSTFMAYDFSDHHIHVTRLGRKQIAPDTPFLCEDKGTVFSDEKSLVKARRILGMERHLSYIPQKLTLTATTLDHIVPFSYNGVLYSSHLAKIISEDYNPGLYFSNVPIRVNLTE